MKGLLGLFLAIAVISGCSSTKESVAEKGKTQQKENKKSVVIRNVDTIEELNKNYLYAEKTDYFFSTAVKDFDFPIYDLPGFVLHPEGTYRSETKVIKNKDFHDIIELNLSEGKIYSLYALTGFYDKQNGLYQEIKKAYEDIAYEEDDKTQSIHWVSSDGLYHRIIYFSENGKIEQSKLNILAEQFTDAYEKGLENPPILPRHIVSSVNEIFMNEYVSGIYPKSFNNVTISVPIDTTIETAEQLGNKYFSLLVKFLKDSPAYDEEKWGEYEYTVSIAYKDNIDVSLIEGNKVGTDQLKWIGSHHSQENIGSSSGKALPIDELHVLADKKVDAINEMIPTYRIENGIEGAWKISIDGNNIPDILQIKMLPTTSEVSILKYNPNKADWVKVYTDSSFEHYFETDPIRVLVIPNMLTEDHKHQIFLGRVSGSGGYLSFLVIGKDKSGKIKILLDRMDESYPQGSIFVDDFVEKKIYIKSYDNVVETLTIEDLGL